MRPNRYLFVSDLHLDASAPEGIAQFIAFLEGEARDAAALYILGDLFEVWVGDDDPEPARNSVCAALRRYTARACPASSCAAIATSCWARGLNSALAAGCCRTRCCWNADHCACSSRMATRCARPIIPTRNSAAWCATPGGRRDYLKLPLATRRALAETARRGSKAHTGQQPARDHGRASARRGRSVPRQRRETDDPWAHPPARGSHRADRIGPALRIVLGDWYGNGSYLALHADGQYEIIALPVRAPRAPAPGPPSAWSPAAGA